MRQLVILFMIVFTAYSCSSDATGSSAKAGTQNSSKINLSLTGEELFVKHCKLCHGIDGSMGLNGAKDLNESTLSLNEQILIVTEGKGAMTPFKKVLTEEEIKKVAEYAHSFVEREQ